MRKRYVHFSTFLTPMLITFIGLFLFPISIITGYIYMTMGQGRPYSELFSVAFITFLIAILLFLWFAFVFSARFAAIIDKLDSMLSGNRALLKRHIPVTSKDEIGQLQTEFNCIQTMFNHKHQALEKELQYAYDVQRRLLPAEWMEWEDLRIAAGCRQTHEVGGDLYDIAMMEDQRIAVIVGDVSGKGMPAALIMSAVITLFRREILLGGTASELLNRLNQTLCELVKGEMFVTLGLAIIDRPQQKLQYASAGHMSPYLLQKESSQEIDLPSLPLGVNPDRQYQHIELPFSANHRFVIYTDGLIEVGEHYLNGEGFRRLEQQMVNLSSVPDIQAWLTSYFESLENLTSTGTSRDDQTLLIAERL